MTGDPLRALLLGVRGSIAVAGADHAAVGGSTSCVAIPRPGGRWLVLDAGTGFVRLGPHLAGAPLQGSVLLTHLHWDHVQGLPFLPNADRDGAEVDLWLPAQVGSEGPPPSALEVLARSMSPPHFPIRPDQLQGRWRFEHLEEGPHEIEGCRVRAARVQHKGGVTFGFRVDAGGRSLAYLPDHAPALARPEQLAAALALADGVDLLLHGGGYLEPERAVADLYGHATVGDALALAERAGAHRLVVVHHAPTRTDAAMAEVQAALAAGRVDACVGREGDWLSC